MNRSSISVLGLDEKKGQQELRPRDSSAMLPLSSHIKKPLISLSMISRPLIYLKVNILNPLPPLQRGTRWDSLVMRTKSWSWTWIFWKSVYLQSPLTFLMELERQARQNITTINFTSAFAKTSSSCNSTVEKCQYSLKSSFKKVKTQVQKGSDPLRAARSGYDQACEYLEIWNKTILIHERALACLSKLLAHILQRELYSMGNTGLLRSKAEMTLLQP